MSEIPTGYQFVWFWDLHPEFRLMRFDPAKTDLAYIYEWVLTLGWLEVWKWRTRRLP